MKRIAAIIFILVFLLSVKSQAYAQTATPTPGVRHQVGQNVFKTGLGQGIKEVSGTPSKFNIKLCEAHVKVAKLREAALAKRASNMQTRLDKIVTMVEAYYTNKLVPEGKSLATYNSLVSDVATKKAALSPLVTKVQTDAEALTCDGGQAKAQFVTFRTDATSLIAAFKAYRLSVINLVQAVRKASGVSGNLTPTVSPATTGEPDL